MLHSISWLWQNYFEVFSGVPYQNRELIKLKLPYGTHNSAIDRPGNFFGFEYAGGKDGAAAKFGTVDSKVEIVNSNWHHVVTVKAGDNLQLYIEGILDVQKDRTKKNPKWSVDNKDPIQISVGERLKILPVLLTKCLLLKMHLQQMISNKS